STRSTTLTRATNSSRYFPMAATLPSPAMPIAKRAANRWTITGACCTRCPATGKIAQASATRSCKCRSATTLSPTCRRRRTHTALPPIYADPQVLDFDALANQVAEPAAHFPARARPGQPLAAGFFQPQPARVPPDMVQHQAELIGPVAQFLTGLFPAV